MPTQRDILAAISLERAATPEFYSFTVTGTEREGVVWKVFVDVKSSHASSLDESFEGSRAWWGGEPTGTADVLSVDPEREQINLRFASKPPPAPGETLRIYPPQFLQPLYDCWHNPVWAERCLNWLSTVKESNAYDPAMELSPSRFPWLRARQRDAFKLPGWSGAFLWGPPGTGKTTTLGALLASYLLQFPKGRVLLFSTTNSAVDLALIAVDEALAGLGPQAQPTRHRCQRLGNHFVARHYEHRRHLLPVADERLVSELARLESTKPDPQNVSAYAAWRAAVDKLRAEARRRATEVLQHSQLVALTTARGVFSFDDLRAFAPFDLVVFDESSQVTLPHALALAPLGRHCLFAGDPRQLAPIVRSSEPLAQRWMGQSMFEYMDENAPSTCMLVEQSRMAEPVCELVSYLFYGKRLVVAEAAKSDPGWLAQRRPDGITARCRRNILIEEIATEGTWSQQYHGPIRYDSARLINELVQELLAHHHTQEDQILIVTPFRAQRALIRTFLRNAGLRRVNVSTVHRAQGSERHTVIFDPVDGGNDFLQTEDARRLINVAISRAQARLIVCLSQGDRKSLLLQNIGILVQRSNPSAGVASPPRPVTNNNSPPLSTPIGRFTGRSDYPQCLVGQTVRIADVVGKITGLEDEGRKFTMRDHSGQHRIFNAAWVRNRFPPS